MILTQQVYVEYWPCCERPHAIPFCRTCKRPLYVSVMTHLKKQIYIPDEGRRPPV